MFKWLFTGLLILHGLIHTIGVVDGFNIVDLSKTEDFTGETIIKLPETVRFLLGFVWLITIILFLIATYGFYFEKDWWQIITIISVIISQILIVIWWPDAKFGTIANILVVIGLLYAYRLT